MTMAARRMPAIPPQTPSPHTPTRVATDAVWLVTGTAVLLISALGVQQHVVADWERSIFEVVNSVTLPFAAVWAVMQLGNVGVVPIAAGVAAATRRFRLAGSVLLGGGLTYYLAKVVKRFVIRGRPPALLDDVHIHGAPAQGLGYVSGHAALSVLLATVVWPYLGRRGRWLVAALAAVVCLARMYVGAHLPLDVLGGAALGVAVGGGMRLLWGRPVRCS